MNDFPFPLQPLKLSENVYNLRKLDELPYHLYHASPHQVSKPLLYDVLANYEWIKTKAEAFSIKGKPSTNDWED